MGTKPAKKKKSPKKGWKPGDVEVGEVFEKELPVKINEKICQRKADRIVEALSERIVQQERAKPFKDKQKQLTEEIEKLRSEIKSCTESRMVKCRLEYDYPHRVVRTRRLDTNTFVKELERTMNDDDRDGKGRDPLLKAAAKKADRDEEPAETPGEAMAAARAESDGEEPRAEA